MNIINYTHTCVSANNCSTPKEKTSRLGPYTLWPLSERASGGMYTSVPGNLVRVLASRPGSRFTIRELPKSVILALRDAVSRTFLEVRSRWTTDSRCRWSSPRATQTRMYWVTERGMLGVDSRRSSRLESSLSMTRRGSREPVTKHSPMNWVMLG